jgi:DNA-binding transcriptional MerR regulator
MPLARKVLNGFTAAEVHAVSELSRPMIEYLNRHGFLRPAYAQADNPRGRVRFYSYRDLVVARLIQRLRETGIQLGRLKTAVERIAQDSFWSGKLTPAEGLNWLVCDGRTCLLCNQDGFLDDFLGGDQRAFAFVINMGQLLVEVRARVPEDKREHFTMETTQLQFVPRPLARRPDRAARV